MFENFLRLFIKSIFDFYLRCFVYILVYNCPLSNVEGGCYGCRVPTPCKSKIYIYLLTPQSLTIYCLCLTGSIKQTVNIFLYVLCIYVLFAYNKGCYREENAIKKNPKEEKIHLLYDAVFIETNLCRNGPPQLKPILFKGQIYSSV